MSSSKRLIHKGIIKSIDDKLIKVSISSMSACASCKAKSVCGADDSEEKIVEVRYYNDDYTIGEQVEVSINQTLGFTALFFGYILPFIVVLLSLIISLAFISNQGIAGIISILTLVPYYLILNSFKEKIKNTFSFSIQKQHNFN